MTLSPFKLESVENSTGVVLTNPEYYMYPGLKDLNQSIDRNGRCIVQGLTIGCKEYGNVYFPDSIDITNMNFDQIVQFKNREITIYSDEKKKPPIGEGLNRRAIITLDNIYPKKKGTDDYLTNADQILQTNFIDTLKQVTLKHNSKFVDYRPKTGSWIFEVEHFSKYAFTESDEEECEIDVEELTPKKKEAGDASTIDLGSYQRVSNSLILDEVPAFVTESPLFDSWSDESCLLDPIDSSVQNIKSCIFANVELAPTKKQEEFVSDTNQRQRRCEVIVTPRIYKLSEISSKLQPTTQRYYKDSSNPGHSTYKVGWASGLTFYNVDVIDDSETIYCLSHSRIEDTDNSEKFISDMPNLIDMLNITFTESEFTFDNKNIPTLHVRQNPSYLQRQNKLFNKQTKTAPITNRAKYLSSVWNLCMALWGPGKNSSFSRKQNLTDWLQKFTCYDKFSKCYKTQRMYITQTEAFQTIFQLLCFYKTTEASKVALHNKMNRLAMLISQTISKEKYKNLMRKYVDCYTWQEQDVILDEYKKIYLLLCGIPVHNAINICDGLDWIRAFSIHLWYIAPATAPIGVAFGLYTKAFKDVEYAPEPKPHYCNSKIHTTHYDLLYHIIGVYVDNIYQLSKVLHPETHTDNILDYRLSWFLLQLFLSLNVGLIRDSEKEYLHISFSTQLENMGYWKWAIFVLLYLEDNVLKKNLITKILDRHISAFDESHDVEKQLVQKYKIPSSWIHSIKAIKTLAEGHYYDCYQHYLYMGDFQQANKILLEHIIPELFINGQHNDLDFFLTKLQPFSGCLLNWQTEAGLFQDYLDLQKVCNKEMMLIGEKLISLVGRVHHFRTRNEQQNVCISELSKKCFLIFKALGERGQQEGYYANFVDMFRNLIMTPDFRHREIFFLVTKYLNEE